MKMVLVAGARPNLMKIAPLAKAVSKHNAQCTTDGERLQTLVVHTGQHYDIAMSGVFFEELDLPPPDINLEVGSASHAVQTANIMVRFEPVLLDVKPDWVIVVGDVNSTLACALVAAKTGIKVAHVEAGLRSFDRTMPEEMNRLVTDSLSDVLFTPSKDGNENLRKEGIDQDKIKFVGNIMIDTLIANLDKARRRDTLRRLDLKDKDFVYVTVHRPSNVDDENTLTAVIENLSRLASQMPVIFPVHPRTNKMLRKFDLKTPHIRLMNPIGYHDSISLAQGARFVLTDSGGLQEETTFFGTPCLTLRPNTERPITITKGSNVLTSPDRLWSDVEDVLNGPHQIGKIPELWDGNTAERILQHFVVS
jgi:UDP-N-acetylglucosamine 2-epimerase (non-hydrolysing)